MTTSMGVAVETFLDPVLSIAMGGLAVLVHLAATRARATLAVRGAAVAAVVTLPIAVAAPAGLILAAILSWPTAGWTALPGFWALRALVLARLGRATGRP